jgi:hypothetical protein
VPSACRFWLGAGHKRSYYCPSLTFQVHRGLSRQLAGGAEFHDRSNFHLHAVFKSRAMPGDFDGLFFTSNMKQKIATDCFLGFNEWAIDDRMPLLSRHDLAFVGKRMSRRGSALFNQPFEPVVPLVHHSLHRFGRKAFVPARAPKQQHVFRFRLRNISAHDVLVAVAVETMPQPAVEVKDQLPVISV